MPRPLVEICAPSVERAREAFALGADRVELCRDIDCGGLTPTAEDMAAIPFLSGPVHVLIRVRPGDFVYNADEIQAMLASIDRAAMSRAAGVVVGALTAEGKIDMETSKALIDRAREQGLSVTFHRAVDEAADYFEAIRDVCLLGVDRILTSGGMPTAFEGRFRLAQLISQLLKAGVSEAPESPAVRTGPKEGLHQQTHEIGLSGASDRRLEAVHPIIMPGKGITGENVREIIAVTGAREVHGTRLVILKNL